MSSPRGRCASTSPTARRSVPAGQSETQMAVVREALDALVGATGPGAIVESGIEWPE